MVQAKRKVTVVSAAIVREGRYLITQRMRKAVLGDLWEFPGGKVEANETDEDALRRELKYRLGVDANIGELLSTVQRAYSDYSVELHLYRCDIGNTQPRCLSVQNFEWVRSDEMDKFEFTPADEASVSALLFEPGDTK